MATELAHHDEAATEYDRAFAWKRMHPPVRPVSVDRGTNDRARVALSLVPARDRDSPRTQRRP